MWCSKVRLVSRTEGFTCIPAESNSCNGRAKATFNRIHLNCQKNAFLFCHIKSVEDTFHEGTLFCFYCSDREASRLGGSI